MCGRFALEEIPNGLLDVFGLASPPWSPRYNLAPTDYSPVILDENGRTSLQALCWGLVPFWSRDKGIGAWLINARAETADEKPAFRAAFRHRRCLVPASGFYEWKREGRKRTPFYFSPPGAEPLVMGGLWEEWTGGDEIIRSFAILTSEANADMAPVHDRMPVILKSGDWARWLDPRVRRKSELADLLRPVADGFLASRVVGSYVNKPGNEGAECLRAVGDLRL